MHRCEESTGALFDGRRTLGRAFSAMRGEDPALRRALEIARRAAVTDCSVLVTGETGTGKELVAQAIHEASPRHQGPMVAINCGAIARELIGSELFGHERGAFTGAATTRDGVFVQAHGGTLFLDELGELPLEQQPHLLRVLETRMVRRLGGNRDRAVDVRVVAATNRLDRPGTSGATLRLDLFHRLATVIVHLPPLRDRPADIPLLVNAFMDELTPELGSHTIASHTMRELVRYSWPGNVRELRQAVRRAMTLCTGELTIDALLHHASDAPPPPPPRAPLRRPREGVIRVCEDRAANLRPIDILVRDAMRDALERNTSMRGAAQALGLAKSTFADWARRLGIVIDAP